MAGIDAERAVEERTEDPHVKCDGRSPGIARGARDVGSHGGHETAHQVRNPFYPRRQFDVQAHVATRLVAGTLDVDAPRPFGAELRPRAVCVGARGRCRVLDPDHEHRGHGDGLERLLRHRTSEALHPGGGAYPSVRSLARRERQRREPAVGVSRCGNALGVHVRGNRGEGTGFADQLVDDEVAVGHPIRFVGGIVDRRARDPIAE